MMDTKNLQNTESITRFLRNKDTEVSDIYIFVTEKLYHNSNDTPVYLPQKEKFILELLVDRISQSNKLFQKFLYSSETWKLFNYIWEICKGDPRLSKTRTKILSKLKFGDIFTKVLKEVYNQKLYSDGVLIEELTTFLFYLVHNMRIHLSDEQNLTLIKYLLLLLENSDSYPYKTTPRILYLMFSIFKLNNTNSISYDTKHKSEFARTCLAPSIMAIHRHTTDLKLKQNFKYMLCKILFSDEDKKQTLSFIEQFASVESNNVLSSEEVLYLLKLVTPKIDVSQLEEIVQILIQFFPSYSTQLLKYVTDMNKTLSTEFLSSLVEKELQRENDASYEVIIHCIKRNSDVTFKYSNEICRLCSKQNIHSLDLFKEVFDSYMKAREVETFVKLWSGLVDAYPGKLFESDDIIDYTSLQISTLSYSQLSQLFEAEGSRFISQPSKTPVFILAASKGMLKAVSGSIQNALSKTLIQNMYQLQPMFKELLEVESEASWKLKFYILSLFDVEEFEGIRKLLFAQKHAIGDYYYFTLLRLIEQDVLFSTKIFLQSFLSYFKNKSSTSFKKTIFCRWFRLVEVLLNKAEIMELVGTFIKQNSEDDIVEVLQVSTLQTQPLITTGFVDTFLASDSLKFFQYISVYALNRRQRADIMDTLLEKLDDLPNTKIILANLIELPTYKSKLETHFKTLPRLAKYCDPKLNEIIKIILSNHLRQPIESAAYLDGLFTFLFEKINSLNIKNCGKNLKYLSVISILVQECDKPNFQEKRDNLISKSIGRVITILSETSDLSIENTSVMIKFLTDVNFQTSNSLFPDNIKEVISTIGLRHLENKPVRSLLFGLVCSLGQLYKPEYIIALYVVLNDDSNLKYLELFISKLTERESIFIESWFCTCDSIKLSCDQDFKRYLELGVTFISNAKKTADNARVRLMHILFVRTISELFTKGMKTKLFANVYLLNCLKTVVSSKGWLFTQYGTELTMVLIPYISSGLQKAEIISDEMTRELYYDLCQICSSIILYQRRRLSNRHHLIISVLTSLMKTLFSTSTVLGCDAALSFERLISNLCEPSISSIHVKHISESEKDADASNALAQTKAGLRKHIPILVLNYIKFYLHYKVDISVKASLDNAVYIMLDLLTLNELNYINKSLDSQGRVIFKSLYEDYKKFYRWNTE